MANSSLHRFSRRALFKGACAGALAAGLRPRFARAATNPGATRALIINVMGGLRWTATFDAQPKIPFNPWGLVPSSVYAPPPSGWGFSRMLLQKPLWMNATGWSTNIYPALTSDASYNLTRPVLTQNAQWNGAALKNFADLAPEVAVVRMTNNPGGQPNLDHAAASRLLHTGYGGGTVGVVTALQYGLASELGSGFSTQYALPAVQVGGNAQTAWSYGVGPFAAARPLVLANSLSLPAVNPGNSVAPWGHKAEGDVDGAFAASRQAFMGQAVQDFMNDKAGADAHVGQLVNPALHLATPPTGASPTMGTLIDGVTPVTNDMLAEVFGLSSAVTPANDILRDAFAAVQSNASPTWAASDNGFGLDGALAVRLLQTGAPVVCLVDGAFDTHSFEVVDPTNHRPHTVQIIELTRMLCGLEFALKNIADPLAPAQSLWSSTVVMVLSEFGRDDASWDATNGFNDPNGANDGGSGHHPWSACLMMGGPVVAGGKLVTSSDPNDIIMSGTPDQASGFFHQNRVYTSVFKAMGISSANNPYLPYGTFAPIPGLLAGV